MASAAQLTFAGTQRAWLGSLICASAGPLPPYQQGPLIPKKGKLRLRPKGACLTMTTAPPPPVAANSLGVSLCRGSRPGPPTGWGEIFPRVGHFLLSGYQTKPSVGPVGPGASSTPSYVPPPRSMCWACDTLVPPFFRRPELCEPGSQKVGRLKGLQAPL